MTGSGLARLREDAAEGGWKVGVVVMPGYGPRVVWGAVGLAPMAVATQVPHHRHDDVARCERQERAAEVCKELVHVE